jgi:hypothetical protein
MPSSFSVDLNFEVKGYPGSGRRTEAEVELATCDRISLLQDAFMGDAKTRLGTTDFSEPFGSLTLLGWMLILADAGRALEAAEQHIARFSESDDLISFHKHGERLFVATSYRPGIASIDVRSFAHQVEKFIAQRLTWLADEYPSVSDNPIMCEVLARLR